MKNKPPDLPPTTLTPEQALRIALNTPLPGSAVNRKPTKKTRRKKK
jgi:hypothetical protein